MIVVIFAAFVYSSAVLGPVLGFGCGAALMEVFVDFLSPLVIKTPLTPTDPQWVGAWWVGFIIFGVLTIVIAPPFFAFPKQMELPKQEEKSKKYIPYEPNSEDIIPISNVRVENDPPESEDADNSSKISNVSIKGKWWQQHAANSFMRAS